MQKPLKLPLYSALLTLNLSLSAYAATSSPDDSSAENDALEVIVVTATGNEETLFNASVTIETVSAQDSEFDRATWIGETVNRMPGVYFSKLRGPVDAPSIRLPVSFDNVYLYLQDNVPLQSPISFNHAAFSYSGALTSPGGMEILKGPGTAIHGSDALAAVVNVKSKQPVYEPETLISYRFGENNLQDLRFDTSGALNDSNAARLAVSYQSDDGWRDTTAWDRTQIIAKHLYEDNGWEINNILSYTKFDSQMAGALTPEALQNDPKSDGLADAVNRAEARDKAEYFRLSSELQKALSQHITLQITPYIRTIDSQYMHTWEPATTPITKGVTDTLGVLSRLYLSWNESSSTILGLDAELTDFARTTEQTRTTQVVWGTTYPQGLHLDYDVNYTSLAPYIQHTQSLSEKLSLVLGLRYEHSDYDYTNHLSSADFSAENPSPFLLLEERKDNFSELLPKASLSYAISERHNVYLRYAKGFRIPDDSDLYILSSSQAEFSLEPETIQSYELGYRGWLGEGISLNAAVYRMIAKGGIVTGIATPAGNISVNGGEEQYQGIELGLQAQLSDELMLTLAGATTDNSVKRKFSDTQSTLDGKTLINSPDPIVNVRLQYQPKVLSGLSAELEIQHTGSWYLDEANTRKTDAENLLNLRMEYAFTEALLFDIKVQNLLDNDYLLTAEAPVWAPEGRFRPGAPRTFSAGLSYTF